MKLPFYKATGLFMELCSMNLAAQQVGMGTSAPTQMLDLVGRTAYCRLLGMVLPALEPGSM